MNAYITFLLLALTSFFTLINPLGVMPIFLSMTADFDIQNKKRTARKAVTLSFIILLLFAITGQFIFRFFAISIDSLKITGGIIFFFMGQDMLQARLSSLKNVGDKDPEEYLRDISITPLAIPMITGPGAITNAIVLMEQTTDFTMKLVLFTALLAICLITYVLLINSARIINFIGETGLTVMMRLMGLIVMVIAVEFFFAGLIPFLEKINW